MSARITLNQVMKALTSNAVFSRAKSIFGAGDSRDYDTECGYPTGVPDAHYYRALIDRDALAKKVVAVYPEECWSVSPEVYETEDESETPFEARWNELLVKHSIWTACHRADELSGYGRFGVILLGFNDRMPLEAPVNPERANDLLYLRTFDESLVTIGDFEQNDSLPRFGQPLNYTLKFFDPKERSGSQNQTPVRDRKVHWTRVIHVTDNRMSGEVFGVPRLQPVLNRVLDCRKVLSGSAEMFWKGAFPGYAFETMPEVAGQVDFDAESIKEQIEEFSERLKRYMLLENMTVKSLAPQVADPSKHMEEQLKIISSATGVPVRILLGTESGHLASTQDSVTWNRRLRGRQVRYLTPYLVRPLVDRLLEFNVLPATAGGKYFVEWKDLNSMSDKDRADVALKVTQAILQYVTSGAEKVMPLKKFLTRVLWFSDAEADSIIHEAKKHPQLTREVWEDPEPVPVNGNGSASKSSSNTGRSASSSANKNGVGRS